MKHLLITTIAAVLLVGCATTQSPEPPTVKAPDISIHDAAHKGNIEAVKQHLDAGTDVNAKDEDGYTPLYAVAGGGHKEIAELLIAKGADVNPKREDGATPLLIAAVAGHKEVAELLIAKGADVNAKDKKGWTLLQHAVMMSKREIVGLLIAKGADVNAKVAPSDRFFKGKTPLDLASKAEIDDLLRKHGGKTAEELKAEGQAPAIYYSTRSENN